MPALIDTEVTPITVEAFTEKVVDGAGVMDQILTSISAHIHTEYDKGRITGKDYATAYVSMISAGMQTALQLLLGKEQTYWNAVVARQEAILKEATLPSQIALATKQLELAEAQLLIQAKELELKAAQIAQAEYQAEATHAQYSNTLRDGFTPVQGTIGAQKALHERQIESFRIDSELKVTRLFTDAWITQKTIDEELLPPTKFANANLDIMLGKLQDSVELS